MISGDRRLRRFDFARFRIAGLGLFGLLGPATAATEARDASAECVSCHDGDKTQPNFRGGEMITDWSTQMAGHWPGGGKFTKSYAELFRYLRTPGIEGDRRMLSPLDYHFSQTELGQILRNQR